MKFYTVLNFFYVFTVEKLITVETSVQHSIQKYDHLTADKVMTANKNHLFFMSYDTFSIL